MVVQDVFARVFSRIDDVREPAALKPFITSVTVFVAREAIRKKRRHRWLAFFASDELPEIHDEARRLRLGGRRDRGRRRRGPSSPGAAPRAPGPRLGPKLPDFFSSIVPAMSRTRPGLRLLCERAPDAGRER